MKHLLFYSLFLFVFVCCKKKDSICETRPNSINVKSNKVYEGWPLNLSISVPPKSTIEISGPNGFYRELSSDDSGTTTVTIDTSTLENSGEYFVKAVTSNCITLEGQCTAEIMQIPTPPCSLTDNSCEHDLIGIYSNSYQNVYGHTLLGEYYEIYGINGLGNRFDFTFNGTSLPKPGKYYSSASIYPNSYETMACAIEIRNGNYTYFMQDDQDVFITKESGKLVITICSAIFKNESTSVEGTVSARLVLN